jgi:serpin B
MKHEIYSLLEKRMDVKSFGVLTGKHSIWPLLFTLCLILFSTIIFSCIQCSGNSSEITNANNGNVNRQTQGSITIIKYDTARDTTPDVSDADVASLAAGNTEFAIDIYNKLSDSTGNIFFSPYSISIALAMTWGGARNQTETDMATVLHFPFAQATLHAAFNALDLALIRHAQSGGFDLHIVNQLWGEKTYTFLPEYLKLMQVNYGAGMYLLDFIGNPEPSRLVINTWVSDSTNHKITDLIPKGSITGNTRLVLTNAIYFKAQWADTFYCENTNNLPFLRSENDTITTKYMSREGDYNYDSTAEYKAIELPYKGKKTSMIIILPATGKMAEIESEISAVFLTALYGSMQSRSVSLQLPKFKFTTGSNSIAGILKSLGMSIAFGDLADFSGINGTGNFYIGDVIHKAYVAVDEKGTEAAAATAVIGESSGIPDVWLSVNRPFIFLIRDVSTNTILFMGKVNDPTKE